jgi:hypothetical protein
MKLTQRKLLSIGLITGALTLAGCATSHAPEESPYKEGPYGHISKTKQSDDNLEMPLEDPLRTKQHESVRAAALEPGVHENEEGTGGSGCTCQPNVQEPSPEERRSNSEAEPSVHETSPLRPESGTGGSGFNRDNSMDDNLNNGGNVDNTFRIPDSPADQINPPDRATDEAQYPDEAR